MNTLKIFVITHNDGNKEWVSGRTNIEALHCLVTITDISLSDLITSTIEEVPRDQWSTHLITKEDGTPQQSFEQYMQENKPPDILAGTMY